MEGLGKRRGCCVCVCVLPTYATLRRGSAGQSNWRRDGGGERAVITPDARASFELRLGLMTCIKQRDPLHS